MESQPPSPTAANPSTSTNKRPLILALLILLVLIITLVYFLSRSSDPTPDPAPTNQASEPAPTVPSNWQTHTHDDFILRYPPEIDISEAENQTILTQWGPSQQPNTEFYDGISLSFTTISLQDQTFEDWINQTLDQETQHADLTEEVTSTTINQYPSFTFTTQGLGQTRHYLAVSPLNPNLAVHIRNSTVDPTNQQLDTTVNLILSTFQFTN